MKHIFNFSDCLIVDCDSLEKLFEYFYKKLTIDDKKEMIDKGLWEIYMSFQSAIKENKELKEKCCNDCKNYDYIDY